MDGRNALSSLAPDGTPWLDQVALGGKRDRTEAEILLAQKRRQNGDGQAPRTMVAGSFRFSRFEKGAICLTSNNQSRTGGNKCSPPELKRPCRWKNWKVICAKKLSGR